MFAISQAPWDATLSNAQYLISLYFIVIAALALFAGFLRTWVTRNEVGARYRGAVTARLGVMSIASVTYALVLVAFLRGYEATSGGFRPNSETILAFAPRYMEWSIAVPLLALELLAVCALVGAASRRAQWLAAGSAFLMIFTGYIGAFVIDGGTNTEQLILWGAISSAFWIFSTVVLLRAVRASRPLLTPEASSLLGVATALLLGGWVIYPVIYLIQIYAFGGGWTTTLQIALCVADIVVKIGFGGLVHRVAKLRTAEDVRAGDDVHPESIWISSIKLSDAGVAREVYLAEGSTIHARRVMPPASSAIATASDPRIPELEE